MTDVRRKINKILSIPEINPDGSIELSRKGMRKKRKAVVSPKFAYANQDNTAAVQKLISITVPPDHPRRVYPTDKKLQKKTYPMDRGWPYGP